MVRRIGLGAAIAVFVATPALAATSATLPLTNYCAPSSIQICGQPVRIDRETAYRERLQAVVPPDYLGHIYNRTPVEVTVHCDIVNGVAQYIADHPESIPCNIFLCQPATLTACGSQVEVGRTAELGESFKAATVNGDALTVECRGAGSIPQYDVASSDCGE